MCKRISISSKNIWDKRSNLTNKPSLSFRSIEVIQHLMGKEEIALGVAIEKLFTTNGLYDKVVKELSEDYPDI